MSAKSLSAVFAIALLLAARGVCAQGLESRLVVVTSFSKELTTPLAQAFEKKNPGTKVEVQNRNSAAAIAFIRESRTSPPDIFWAAFRSSNAILKKS